MLLIYLYYSRRTPGQSLSASKLFIIYNIPLIICLTTHLVNFDLVIIDISKQSMTLCSGSKQYQDLRYKSWESIA